MSPLSLAGLTILVTTVVAVAAAMLLFGCLVWCAPYVVRGLCWAGRRLCPRLAIISLRLCFLLAVLATAVMLPLAVAILERRIAA